MRKLVPLFLSLVFFVSSCKKENAANMDPLKSGLIAFYPFNGNAQDESGNNYHLIVHDAILSDNRFNEQAKAYSFDGVKSFMKIPGLVKADSLRNFTISVWVKPERLDDFCVLSFRSQNDYVNCSSYFGFDNNPGNNRVSHQMVYSLKGSTCTSSVMRDSIPSPYNQWVHLVVVQQYNTEHPVGPFYIYNQYYNGKKMRGGSGSKDIVPSSFGLGGVIGCNNSSGNMAWNYAFTKGVIDDVRIYNRALSDAEVLQLFKLDF